MYEVQQDSTNKRLACKVITLSSLKTRTEPVTGWFKQFGSRARERARKNRELARRSLERSRRPALALSVTEERYR